MAREGERRGGGWRKGGGWREGWDHSLSGSLLSSRSDCLSPPPPPLSHLLPLSLLLSRSADASFPLLSLQTSNTAAIPAMRTVHQANNDFHSHMTSAARGAEQMKATEWENSLKLYDRLSYLTLRFEELNSVKMGKGQLCGQLEKIMSNEFLLCQSQFLLAVSMFVLYV